MDLSIDPSFIQGEEPLEYEQRRKVQNRLAQRKFREKAKARKQNAPLAQEKNPSDPASSFVYPTTGFGTCMLQTDWNADITDGNLSFFSVFSDPKKQKDGSMKKRLHNPYDNLSILKLPGEGDTDKSNPLDSAQDNLPGQSPAHFENREIHRQQPMQVEQLRSEDVPDKDCHYFPQLDRADNIIRYQRSQLCGQAEELIEKVMSLYDIGLSLGVLVSTPKLRNLLTATLEGFRLQKALETCHAGEDQFTPLNE